VGINYLRVTVNDLLRYGYGGLVALLVADIIIPKETREVIAALGSVLGSLVALAVGAAVYSFYRPVLGELVIYPLVGLIHRHLLQKLGYCKLSFLEERYGVPRRHRVNAYRLIRDSTLFSESMRSRFLRQHSEIHLLYITFTVLGIGAAILWIQILANDSCKSNHALILSIIAFVSWVSGVVGDILICGQECVYLMSLNQDDVRSLLGSAELRQNASEEGAT